VRPVRERLMSMLFLAGIAHAIIILGLSFSAGGPSGAAPGMEVLLVTEDLPEARSNEHATYLAQRTQQGSGNAGTRPTGSPDSRPAPRPAADAGQDESSAPESGSPGAARTLATRAPAPQILWLGETGVDAASTRSRQVASSEPRAMGMGTRASWCCAAIRRPASGSAPTPGLRTWRPIWTPGGARSSVSHP